MSTVVADTLARSVRSMGVPGVVMACADSSDVPPPLLPREAESVRKAVQSRQREFALGRWCARTALASFGAGDAELPVGGDRAPIWPDGVVGSISHCQGFVGALVASTRTMRALGFDAEPATALDEELRPMVCTPGELTWLSTVAPPPAGDWAKVLFSTKEAVHKCIGPLTGTMLDFRDVSICIDHTAGTYSVAAETTFGKGVVELDNVRGWLAFSDGLLFTCAWLPRSR
jgi:4'-phosphopantetheinyl transferase EntD